jgi:hypothetical protein
VHALFSRRRVHHAVWYRWDVVCGDGDQGLFVYVFLVLLRGRTFAYPVRDPAFRVHHFYALHKPWGKKTRCLEYYRFMRSDAFLTDGRSLADPARRSHCLRKLDEKRGCLEASELPYSTQRDELCRTCTRNGQKHTCPQRRRKLLANGSAAWVDDQGTAAFCPTGATRWWVF